jgi:hypothetical protein
MKGVNIFRKFFFTNYFLLLLLVFLINLFLRKYAVSSFVKFLGYNQLYYDQGKIHIQKAEVRGDSIEFFLEGKALKGAEIPARVYFNGNILETCMLYRGQFTYKPPVQGKSTTALVLDNSSDTVFFHIDYTPDSLYARYGNASRNRYEVTSNVLMGAPVLYGKEDWKMNYWGEDTLGMDARASALLRDSVGISKGETTVGKIIRLATFILTRTAKYEGIPADSISVLHPLKQLAAIQNGKSAVWCGNYTSIFSYLATKSGLTVRLVSCGQSSDHYSNGVHVFSEVFLEEEKSWAYVDLTTGNILVRKGSTWLNAIDIQRLLRYPEKDSSLVACHFENDSLYMTPFAGVSGLTAYYFHPSNSFTFYFGPYLEKMNPRNVLQRVVKLFYTGPAYAVYSDNGGGPNFLRYARIFSNYLLVFLFGIWLTRVVLMVLLPAGKKK